MGGFGPPFNWSIGCTSDLTYMRYKLSQYHPIPPITHSPETLAASQVLLLCSLLTTPLCARCKSGHDVVTAAAASDSALFIVE